MIEASTPGVLLVDDDELVLAGLQRALRPLRLPLLVANTAEQAQATLAGESVGVIVCEPHDDRLAAFLIAARHSQPIVVRVILTGYPGLNSVIQAVNEAYPFKLLTKPWLGDELCANINQAMTEYQANLRRAHMVEEYTDLRTSTERAHAYRSLPALTHAVPVDIGDAAIQTLAVAAVLHRHGFLIQVNAAATRLLMLLQEPVPAAGMGLDEVTGLMGELLAAADVTPQADGLSERVNWRSTNGQRLDFFVKQLRHGTLITLACPPS
jgi:DNA-binding NtrC family response regulator